MIDHRRGNLPEPPPARRHQLEEEMETNTPPSFHKNPPEQIDSSSTVSIPFLATMAGQEKGDCTAFIEPAGVRNTKPARNEPKIHNMKVATTTTTMKRTRSSRQLLQNQPPQPLGGVGATTDETEKGWEDQNPQRSRRHRPADCAQEPTAEELLNVAASNAEMGLELQQPY